MNSVLDLIDPALPVIIAGPTASGKSALALAIAEAQGGAIINADALQVWSCWRVLTARPPPEDMARAPHHLYGHLAPGAEHSVGHWLAEVAALLARGARPIVVGGTGMYLSALTEGLSVIPPIPGEIRTASGERLLERGLAGLAVELDAESTARIDLRNPARVRRAWEVLKTTGRGIARWQAEQGAPLLPLSGAMPLLIDIDRDLLTARIETRFDAMLSQGALDEVRAMLPHWNPAAPWAKAIGAADLVTHLRGEITLEQAATAAKSATRQYAKRQRTWFRSRMAAWRRIAAPTAALP